MSEIQLRDAEDFSPNAISNLTHFAYLTQVQKIILVTMLEGMTTDLIYTDTEIAEKAGVARKSVYDCKQNAHFLACLSEATKNITKSEAPKALLALKQKAFSGNVRAIDLLIRYTGDFIPKSQVESKSQSINANISLNSADAIGEFVSILYSQGWNIERIHAEIDEAYQRLKSQSAVV
jgi:hypothetical protein